MGFKIKNVCMIIVVKELFVIRNSIKNYSRICRRSKENDN